ALPGQHITEIKDFQEKLAVIIQEAPKWDVGVVAGIPTWCVKVMEEIVAHYQVKRIQDIWPNFKVYVHGGVYLDPYIKRLENLSTSPLILLDTYLASEGYFAYQDSTASSGMKLLLNRGIFFEFVPFNKDYFDSHGDLIDRFNALTIDEIEENKDYALVISTNSGLWRYILGDLVRFVDKKEMKIIISGRIKQTLNLCGEHLTLDNLNQAVKETCENVNLPHADYTIISNYEGQVHQWYMEEQEGVEPSKLIELIDRKICSLNDDYTYVRKNALNSPTLTYLPKGSFYNYMKSLNKLGAQNKMPRVLNKQQAGQWLEFIKSI
ncbi:MAG: GH3 auxin-responsive promoter family protein, partial [Bacteroidota bacterium]